LKITTIYVTHSQDEAFAISDRVAILNDGLVIQVGTPEELYDNPANEFVARFLGSGNILAGEVTEVSGKHLMVTVNGSQFKIKGNGELNSQIKFSIKPEDVIISDSSLADSAEAELVSITPQVGAFKVTVDFNGTSLIALTYDEELVKRLRTNDERSVVFSFKAESVIILRD
jgi:ABC-type Fe3+/spermidine/putrescine transport system ATPase subunit